MKDKLQEAAEEYTFLEGYNKRYVDKRITDNLEAAFKAGAQYQSEQSKEAIQELVSALDSALELLAYNGILYKEGGNVLQKHKK